jgi:hypothetical protein
MDIRIKYTEVKLWYRIDVLGMAAEAEGGRYLFLASCITLSPYCHPGALKTK